ncbi:MAG: hypothetical protein QM831_07000 [Kofleriaceae bacterium]
MQVDVVPWSQHSVDEVDADGNILNEETLTLRRAFFRAIAEKDAYFAELELDGNTVKGPAARVVTSQVGWHYEDYVRVRGGLLLIPFGSYTPTNARDRFFMEQPTFIRALFPGDVDGGVSADGQYGYVRWSASAMNGAPVSDAQWAGRDPSSSFDVMGRLGADVPLPDHWRVVAGVSAVTGKGIHPGQPPTKDSFQWVDANQDGIVQSSELSVVPGSPGEPSQEFSRDAVDVDVAVHWCVCALGKGKLQFEGAIAKNLDRGVVYADPIARSRNVRELGFVVDLVQELGKYALAGVRYDRYNADRDAAETEGAATVYTHEVFSTVSVLAAAKIDTARLSVQYDHVTNPFGRSDSGQPTTERADRITIRGQVEF